MNKRTPVPGYRLLRSPSTKIKLKDNHYETPCSTDRAIYVVQVSTDQVLYLVQASTGIALYRVQVSTDLSL